MLKDEVTFQNSFFFAVVLECYFLNAVQNISKTVKATPMKFSGLLFGIKSCGRVNEIRLNLLLY